MSQQHRVRVLCPAAAISGGPEALHQLVSVLRRKKVDAAIVYYPAAPIGNPVPTPYRQYDVAVTDTVEDDASTVVVVPEVITSAVWKFPMSKKAIWWLSVDNYFKWLHINGGPSVLVPHPDLIHLCQSQYAYSYLKHSHVQPLLMLTDFLTEGAFSYSETAERLPAAAYNPKRTSRSLQQIMRRTNDCIWLPLQDMDRTELSEVLRTVRLYVDFGLHPGRDRIPREAALCGAVVVVGRKGSAGFVEDLPLPERFRLDEQMIDFEVTAVRLIRELLESETAFSTASAAQQSYRDWIRNNRNAFEAEVEVFIAAMHLRVG